jgi:hypothetical protein
MQSEQRVTQRCHVEVSAVHYIGKEANLYDEQTYLGSIADAQVVYGLGKTQVEAMLKEICAAVAKYGALRFAKATRFGRSTFTSSNKKQGIVIYFFNSNLE